jgi:hypothetical protein
LKFRSKQFHETFRSHRFEFFLFSASRNENSFPHFQAKQFSQNNEQFNDDSVQPFHKSTAADTQNIPIELSSNGEVMQHDEAIE